MPTGTNPDTESGIWRADDLQVNVDLQRVTQGNSAVELPKLSFDLLLTLLQAAPRFVSNEELMQRVWKGLVVSPETVTQRVKLLRDGLGDDPRQPRYIEGLRGRGYRLIPVVTRQGTGTAATGLPGNTSAALPTRTFAAWIAAAGAVVLLAVAGVGMFRSGHAPADSQATAADRTVAVLPFRGTGEVASAQSLVPGFTESVLSQLAGVRGLTVISGNSSSKPDMRKLGPQETGRQLGARYLVEGLIQEQGNQRRVTVSLIDSRNGASLWTQQYDRDVQDFFGMQDAVAGGVAHALESRISGMDPSVPAGARSSNINAQLAYLRGRTLLGRTTIVDSDVAIAEFQQALALDPAFAPAMTGLYDARLQAASLRRKGVAATREANAPLLTAAEQAQPGSGAALLARAMWSDEKPEVRADYFERGLKLDVANARAMTAYSELLDGMDRREDATRWLERALQIDPLWPRARFRAAQRNFPAVGAAVEQQNLHMLELDPNYYPALQRRAKYQWQHHGEIAQAIEIIERAIASDPENPWGPHTAVAFYLDLNEPQSAEDVVRGNDVAQGSTRVLRAQYQGDWRIAGEAAMADSSFSFGGAERWGVVAALRDYALHGLRTQEIIQLISKRYRLPLDGRWELDPFNFREAQMLAHLLLATGRRQEALLRLDEVIAWIDANAYMGPVYNLRTRAQALALKGDGEAALAGLADSFRQDDYTQWWYTLQRDPTWDSFRGDPRFAAMASGVRRHIAAQALIIAALRSKAQLLDRRSGGPLAPSGR